MNCSSESAILFVVVCVGASVKRPITLLVEINTSDDFEVENFFAEIMYFESFINAEKIIVIVSNH